MSDASISKANLSSYVGRFAPSPSGPLHFGSLVCALASFLHAKQHNGIWLVRIEDIDTPRVDARMSKVILSSLDAHHLHPDTPITYQSKRHHLYQDTLTRLNSANLLYGCACSRRQIKARTGFYDGHCRNKQLGLSEHVVRFKQAHPISKFDDLHLGEQQISHPMVFEDPILKRKDGIYAYHIAVVSDDIEQNVTHIVRGHDILETTPIHLSLYQALNAPAPQYLHIPVIVQKPGEKLSKQHHSPAIDDSKALDNIKLALQFLGISRTESANTKYLWEHMHKIDNISALLDWAIEHWSVGLLPKKHEILISTTNGVYSESQHEFTPTV